MSLGDRSGSNGNGSDAPAPRLDHALESVAERIREKAQVMKSLAPDEEPLDLDDWKGSLISNQEDLKKIHKGLVVIAETAEVAVEAMLLVARDQKAHMTRSAPALEAVMVSQDLIETIAAKVATCETFVNQVDQMVADDHKVLGRIRRDVHDIKVDLAAVKEQVALLPAMKSMLADIITRLPEDQPEDNGGIQRLESMLGDIIKRLPDPEVGTEVKRRRPTRKR